VSSILKRR